MKTHRMNFICVCVSQTSESFDVEFGLKRMQQQFNSAELLKD